MEAIRLAPDLSNSVGQPFYLFKRLRRAQAGRAACHRVQSPHLCQRRPVPLRTRNGKLLMLWSSYRDGLYMKTLAYSVSENWEGRGVSQRLCLAIRGHRVLFRTFDNNAIPAHYRCRP